MLLTGEDESTVLRFLAFFDFIAEHIEEIAVGHFSGAAQVHHACRRNEDAEMAREIADEAGHVLLDQMSDGLYLGRDAVFLRILEIVDFVVDAEQETAISPRDALARAKNACLCIHEKNRRLIDFLDAPLEGVRTVEGILNAFREDIQPGALYVCSR